MVTECHPLSFHLHHDIEDFRSLPLLTFQVMIGHGEAHLFLMPVDQPEIAVYLHHSYFPTEQVAPVRFQQILVKQRVEAANSIGYHD